MLRCLAGVDEAGLGPILGPLVVAGVAMRGPEGVDPWQVLAPLVSRHRFEKGKVRVADSKKVNTGVHGLRHLEETALTFWAALHGELPPDLARWLQLLGADLEVLRRCPWYEGLALPLPTVADAGSILLAGELVARRLREHQVELLHLAVRPVDVEEWNGLIADTDNKSRAHFHAFAAVISQLLATLPGDGHLVADRCGGRMHYGGDLRRLRPGARIQVLQETPAVSSYLLQQDATDVTVTFAEKGEDRAFPTALASCFAKYLRELMVRVMNDWFCAQVPGLQRTAGYYTDGHRFLDDLQPHWQRLQLPRQRLVRVR